MLEAFSGKGLSGPKAARGRARPAVWNAMALVASIVVCTCGLGTAQMPAIEGYNVRDYGASGDGSRMDTEAVQKAIDACHDAGGGTVYFPAGEYLSGTLFLKSRVTLYLDSGAVLRGSEKLDDYPATSGGFESYTNSYTVRSLICAKEVDDVAIVGRGAIGGRGGAFRGNKYKKRPYLMRFVSCKGVCLKDIRLRNSAMWTVHFLACEDVVADGVNIHTRVNSNNDGLDIDCCRNVRVANCDIWTGDDAIVLKSTGFRPTENVTITNCILSSLCNALKMGTESNGGFQRITISNCVVYDTRLSGLALEIVDGGVMDGITVSNLAMKNVGCPLFIRLGNRARPPRADMDRPGIGTLRNITISNIEASGAGVVGGSITGLDGHCVENVTLSDLRFTFDGGADAHERPYAVPEKEKDYPEFKMFGELPAYGLFCRHVRNLTIRNVRLGFDAPDHRPALICDDVENLDITQLNAMGTAGHEALVHMRNVRGVFVHGCMLSAAADCFIALDGAETECIAITGNSLGAAGELVRLGPDVDRDALRRS